MKSSPPSNTKQVGTSRIMNATVIVVIASAIIIFAVKNSTSKTLEQQAKEGDTEAQYQLAMRYYNLPATSKNAQDCFIWAQKAAQQGHPKAQRILGSIHYLGGQLAPEDQIEALTIRPMPSTNVNVQKSMAEAFYWYLKSAKQGDAEAQDSIARMYAFGEGVTKSSAEALKWYFKSAEQGNPSAQCSLAEMFRTGNCVTQDWIEAKKWYRKAGDQGYDLAQNERWAGYENLEAPYPKNAIDATNRWLRAAAKGEVTAYYNLGNMLNEGDGVEQNRNEAAKWFLLAAQEGHVVAQLSLGEMQETGNGMPQDLVEAYKWYNLAATKELIGAIAGRERLSHKLTQEQIAEGQKRATEFFKRKM